MCGAGRFGLCRVIDTVEDYISGNITVDQALGKLRYTSPNNQICILSQSLLDKYYVLLIASGLMIYEKGGRYERTSALEKGRPVDIMRLRDRMNPLLRKRIEREGIYV